MTSGWLATPGIVFPLAMVVAMSPMAVVPAVLLVLHAPAPKRSARVPIVIGSGLLVRPQHCGKVRRVGAALPSVRSIAVGLIPSRRNTSEPYVSIGHASGAA